LPEKVQQLSFSGDLVVLVSGKDIAGTMRIHKNSEYNTQLFIWKFGATGIKTPH
jgi:hypothetical protein